MPQELPGFVVQHQPALVQALFVLQMLSAAVMCGIIWFVQVVHYPLFARTGVVEFPEYHRRHMQVTGFVVGPVMLLEVVTVGALILFCPAILGAWQFTVSVLLLGAVWASTAFLQVPQHRMLRRDYSRSGIRALVTSNWIRTIAWSARLLLLVILLLNGLQS